ncbi:MAG: hypothetical protein ACTSW1_00115 [Candidatus Hodarchaeales archaeon]
MQAPALENEIWTEDNYNTKIYPEKYQFYQLISASIDLLKALLTEPARAMNFPMWVFMTLFITTLGVFSFFHSILVILTANFENIETITFLTGMVRIFCSTLVAVMIAVPGVVLMWVITPKLSFKSTFKRFLFYYQTVLLFSLLGELFLSKFIIDSSMKLQPFVVILAGSVAIHLLQKALGQEKNIYITRFLIVGILTLSYLQSFLIIDGLIPYPLQDNIDSPITKFLRKIFAILFN